MTEIEYRSVIKFYYLLGKTPEETLKDMMQVYKSDCPSKATLYYWLRQFKCGRNCVEDDNTKSGRPTEISDKKAEQCEQLIREDRRIKVQDIASSLKISKGSAVSMVSDLGFRKLCSRFVPKFLSPEMKEARLVAAQSNLDLFQEWGMRFLDNIVTQDETTLSKYLPESKRTSAEWRKPDEKPPIKMRSGTSHRREFMFSIFWTRKGIVTTDFLDKGIACNASYFSKLVTECKAKKRKTRNVPLWLLIDNAPIHTSKLAQDCIEECGFRQLIHPPYSPDIAPSDYYLFRHLKKELAGKYFSTGEELKSFVNEYLNSLDEAFFKAAFDELLVRWRKMIVNDGGYIEK